MKYPEGNPKDVVGRTKMPLASVVPSTLEVYAGMAFAEGADKYGPFNWRQAGVAAMVYVDACQRHIKKWVGGERCDQKTLVPHLANAIACLGIILDAEFCNKLIDDRPPKIDMAELIALSEDIVKALRKYHRANKMEYGQEVSVESLTPGMGELRLVNGHTVLLDGKDWTEFTAMARERDHQDFRKMIYWMGQRVLSMRGHGEIWVSL